jgi:O-antigen/teichoic acid export membrane protein
LDGLTIVLSSLIVGRTLGVERLGTFGWIISACGLVTLAAGLGLKEAVTILVQRKVGDDAGVAGLLRFSLSLRLISGAAAAGVTLASLLLVWKTGLLVSLAAGAYVVFVLVSGLLSSFNIALFQTSTVAAGKLVSALVTIGFVVAGSILGSTVLIFAGLAAGALAGSVVFALPLRRLAMRPSRAAVSVELLSLSLSLWLIGLFNYMLGAQAIPFVLKLAGTDTAGIGVVTAGLTVAVAANRAFMGGFATVTLAAFSRAWVTGGPTALQRIYSLYVRVTAMAGVPILLAAIVFAPLLARLSLKEAGPEVASVIVVLCSAFLVSRLAGGGGHAGILYVAGLNRQDLVIRATCAIVTFVAVYYAAAVGIVVAAAVGAGCPVAAIVAEYVVARRNARVAMPWRALAKIAAVCGVVALASLAVYARGGAFATVFAALVFAAGTASALMVARPLAAGETAEIGARGLVAALMTRFESAKANVD